MIPVAIRAFNRPVMLDVTLKSVLASGVTPLVLDDCSDDPTTRAYLDTDDVITLPEPLEWPAHAAWEQRVGRLATVRALRGIAGRVEGATASERYGAQGAAFWAARYLFARFPDAEAVCMLESDCVVAPGWYEELCSVAAELAHVRRPDGDALGILSAYHRMRVQTAGRYAWREGRTFRGALDIGALAVLLTRTLFERAGDAFHRSWPVAAGGPDKQLIKCCWDAGCTIAALTPSRVQHIGFRSIADPTIPPPDAWLSEHFACPNAFAFEARTPERVAYSPEWT